MRPRSRRVRRGRAPGPRELPARRSLRGRARPDVLRAVPGRHRPRSSAGCASATRRPTASSSTSARREYLVGASPEMYVRVEGDRVETCPISGTVARGQDPLADAAQILKLLNSAKDESELTMCTDVDRNDKSRICRPGQRARDRPAADRDVLAPDPHRRPRGGPPARGLRRARRLPRPRLGGHRDRRAQGVGHAVHRGPREVAARLVRRAPWACSASTAT